MKYRNSTTRDAKGFTIIETLVSISILLIVIVGPMAIAARGLQSSYFANDQTTAVFLAQEALESIVKFRDNEALEELGDSGSPSDTWDWVDSNGPLAPCKVNNFTQRGCRYDPATNAYATCGNPDPKTCELRFDGQNYSHQTGDYSGFVREIKLNTVNLEGANSRTEAVAISVRVSWGSPLFGEDREVELQTYLYDHYNRY